jgi:hypothetical protein
VHTAVPPPNSPKPCRPLTCPSSQILPTTSTLSPARRSAGAWSVGTVTWMTPESSSSRKRVEWEPPARHASASTPTTTPRHRTVLITLGPSA